MTKGSKRKDVIFLHGAGTGPHSWDAVIHALPERFNRVAPQIRGLSTGDHREFSIEQAANDIVTSIEAGSRQPVSLCGLSLGGMVATKVASLRPDLVESLVLSGSQVRPNRRLMALQSTILRLLPERSFRKQGMAKAQALQVFGVAGEADLTNDLVQLNVPTLVLCGSRDRANLPAAKQISQLVAGSKLRIIPGAGHEWNVAMPDTFANEVVTFLERNF